MRFALDRSVGASAAAVFLMTLGEELWKRFLPKYLQALGAPVLATGAYGSLRDLVEVSPMAGPAVRAEAGGCPYLPGLRAVPAGGGRVSYGGVGLAGTLAFALLVDESR
jgi:hypothetical protein